MIINITCGTTFLDGVVVDSNPGPAWQVKGTGDGDGKSDIIWQHDNGTPAIWFVNGTAFVSGGIANSNPGSAWHIIANSAG